MVLLSLSGSAFAATITYNGRSQTYTVPYTGTYQIVAYGAQGGDGAQHVGVVGGAGGKGAEIGINVTLTAGDILTFYVGGQGGNGLANNGAGAGGGGTFVYRTAGTGSPTLLLAAGGGGGGGWPSAAGLPGLTTNSGGAGGDGDVGGSGGAAGSNGNGGGGGNAVGGAGGGGGGVFGSGGNGTSSGEANGDGGGSYPGFAGGSANDESPGGGYGGGGGAGYAGGGGGGGYSGGGGGGGNAIGGPGGGGGSYYNSAIATLEISTSGANSGNGYASVTALTPAPASHFQVTAASPETAGSAFSFTVTALASDNSTATGYTGTVSFSTSDRGAGVSLPGSYTFTAGDNGSHTFSSGATLVTAGNQTITATDTASSSITGASGTIVVSPGPATHLSVSAPANAVKGNSFSFTVTALDAFNNTATGYAGTVLFSSTDSAAVLPANATLSSGTKTFTATLNTAGTQTITATDSSKSSISGMSSIAVPTPSSFTVTSTLDPAVSSPGTLRYAITQANASATGATIDLTGVSGTITLTQGALPQLATSMTLTGPGASSLAISGNNAYQVFSVANGITVSISGVTVENGLNTSSASGGGGIYNGGTLNLSSCIVTGNRQTVSGFGGGIFNDASASLTIEQCTVGNNQTGGDAPAGGGLYNLGAATIDASTFSGNTVAGNIGGPGQGGAILNGVNAQLTIVASTISGNSATDPDGHGGAQGGAIFNTGTLAIRNSTIVGNRQTGVGTSELGGGIYGGATLTNTILAGNTDTGGNPDGSGPFTSGGNNLIGNGTGVTGIGNGVNGDIVGTSTSPVDPQLGSLASNGGPTQTMLPLVGSPVIGAGSTIATTVVTDQRGYPRTVGGNIDIGAVEFQGVTLSTSAGSGQSASDGAPFTNPLTATWTETTSGAPLVGDSVVYAAPASAPTAVVSSPAITDASGVSSETATAGTTSGGPYNVTATLGGVQATFALTNLALSQTITFNPLTNVTYGAAPFTISAAASSTLTVSFASTTTSVCTVNNATQTVTIVAAGPCSITATQSGNAAYAAATPVSQGFTVNKAPLTVSANPVVIAYGNSPSYSAAISGFVNGDNSSVVTGAAGFSANATLTNGKPNAGSWTITPNAGTLAASNYTFSTFNTAALTVNKDALTVNANPVTIVYGNSPSFSAAITGFVNGDTSASAVTGTAGFTSNATLTNGNPNAGSWTITPTLGTLAASNYTFSTFNPATLTVNKAPLTVTANPATIAYGAALPTLSATITGFVNGDTSASAVTGAASLSSNATLTRGNPNAGSWTIVPTVGTLGASNYTFSTFDNGTLTVNKATLTVTAQSYTIAAGSPTPTFMASTTGFVNGDTAAVVSGSPGLTLGGAIPACNGSVPIVAALGSLSAANYTFAFVNGTLTVTAPAPVEGFAAVGGGGQSGPTGFPLGAPLVVALTSSGCGAISPAGQSVTFTVVSGSAILGSPVALTGANGTAQTSVTPTSVGQIVIQAWSQAGFVQFTETGLAPTLAPGLQAFPSSLSFSAVSGAADPAPANIAVVNTGAGFLNWTATSSASWLSVTPGTGTTASRATVSADVSGLAAGTYSGKIDLAAGGATASVAVTLTVLPAAPAAFSFSPAAVTVNALVGASPFSQSVSVANLGSAALNWTAVADTNGAGSWLTLGSNAGTAPDSIALTFNPAGLTAGQYAGSVQFTGAGGQTGAVNVVLNLTALPALISTTPAVQFSGVSGAVFSQSLPITTSTGTQAPIVVAADQAPGSSWLKVTSSGSAPGTISVTAESAGLAAGQYVAYIDVTSPAAANTLIVPVTLNIGGATGTLAVSPGGVVLTATGADLTPNQNLTLASNGSSSFSWSAAVETSGAAGAWLSVSPVSGSANGSLTVSANAQSLAPGSYAGQIVISASGTSNSSVIVPVTLIVPATGAGVVLQSTAPSSQFTATAGVPMPISASLFTVAGAPVLGASVTASFSTGEGSITLTDAGGGNYVGAWSPQQTGPVAIAFSGPLSSTAIVTGTVASSSQPAVFRGGAVDSADVLFGTPLSAGAMGTLYGLNFTTQTLSAPSLPLPLTLGGFSVSVNGYQAPLYYVSPGQINFFVPWEVAGATTLTIRLADPNGIFEVSNVPLAPASPGLFLVDSAGDPAITDADFNLIDAKSPAKPGQPIVIFASGLGPVLNQPADGGASPSVPLATDLIPPVVTIGGMQAQVLGAALTPTLAGLYQVDVIVPSGLPSGPAPVTVYLGGLVSPTVEIPIQ